MWDWAFAFEILPVLAKAAIVIDRSDADRVRARGRPGARFGPRPHRLSLDRLADLGSGGIDPLHPAAHPDLLPLFRLPVFRASTLDAFTAGVLALGIHYAAYCSEVYRAGFDNIHRGQWEASVALNLSAWTTFRDIIIPQAIPPIVPALGNYLVALFKETPLLSAIAVLELMQTAKIIGSETFRYTEPITLVGLFFLAMSLVSAAFIRAAERMLNRRPAR